MSFLILAALVTLIAARKVNLNQRTCEITRALEPQPDRRFRLGLLFDENECTPEIPEGQCLMGLSRIEPYKNSLRLNKNQ